MPQNITKSVMTMVKEAKAQIEELEPADAIKLHGNPDVVFVDIRDPRELERDGKVPGAFHVTRGMLEFWIDPASPYYREEFGSGKKFIFYCAGGMRSALATLAVQRMGLAPVAHMAGGFGAWVKAGGAVEPREAKLPTPKS